MNRRRYLKTVAAMSAATALPSHAAAEPIQLHLDLEVEAAKAKDMVKNFHQTFRPTITKQPGFVDVKLLKLRTALAGPAPANSTYRLVISFQTEEQRKTWVATADHQKAWPTIESNLKGAKFGAILYDVV